ncbi:MAG: hypothetical protein ABR526_13385 [Chthoniobacterales bacterium]
MNTLTRVVIFCLFGLTALAYGGAIPSLDVAVSGPGGNVAYKGKTTGLGTFSTGSLPPGAYVVRFSTKNSAELKGSQFGILVAGGKQKMGADAIAGERFGGAGVAVKVDVGAGMKVTGQLVNASAAAQKNNVKIVNGKRFVRVREVGSNLTKWVEEGTPEAGNVIRASGDGLTRTLDGAGDTHQEGFPVPGTPGKPF